MRLSKTLLAAAAFSVAPLATFAATYQWDTNGATAGLGGTGAWDTASLNWDLVGAGADAGADTTVAYTFTSADTAVFGGTAGTVTLGTGVTLNGLTFNTTGYTVTGNTITLAGTTPTITAGAGVTATISSTLAGTAGLVKAGAGTVRLAAENTYSGNTIVNGGTLELADPSNNGTGSIRGTIDINSGGTVALLAPNALGWASGTKVNTININSGGTLRTEFNGDNGWGLALNLTGGAITATNSGYFSMGGDGSSGPASITSLASATTSTIGAAIRIREGNTNNQLNVTVADGVAAIDLSISGVISQQGAARGLVKNGPGNLELTGANTYQGLTSVNAGRLILTNTNQSSVTIASGATLEFANAGTVTYGTSVTYSGAGTIEKTGAGTIQWGTSAATFSMGAGSLIRVLEGTFVGGSNGNEVWNSAVPGTNPNLASLEVASGATFAGVEANVRVDALTGAGTISSGYPGAGYQNFTFGVNNGSGTFSGVLQNGSAAANFVKIGTGTQTLAGNNTFTGTMSVDAGALRIGHANALGGTGVGTTVASGAALEIYNNITTATEALSLVGSGISSGGALRNISGTNTYAGAITLTGDARINSDAGALTLATLNDGGFALTFGGAGATTVSGVISGSGSLAKDGAGTLTLSGADTYTGGTTITAGTLNVTGSLANAGAVTVDGATAIYTVGASDTVGAVTLKNGGTINGSGILSASSVNVEAGTIAAALSGSGALTKSTTGTVTLSSNSNAYTGATTITAGKLILSGLLGSGAYAGAITDNGVFEYASSGTQTLSGAITGSGSLLVSGSGTLNLSGSNSYSGGTTVNAGTLNFTATGSLPTGGALTVNGGTVNLGNFDRSVGNFSGTGGTVNLAATRSLTVNQAAAGAYSGTLSGAGTLIKSGAATLTLSGANTGLTGGFTVSAGVLALGSADALGSSGSITLAGGTLQFSAANTSDYSARLAGASTAFNLDTNGQDVTLASAFGLGGATLDKIGAGTLTLTGANAYDGLTTVRGGTLKLGAANALGTTAAGTLVKSGATLDLNGQTGIAEALTLEDGGLLANNAGGSLVFSGSLSFLGNATLGGGLEFTSPISIASGFGLTKDGSGILTLSGANTYTGATTVQVGTLKVNNAAAISTSSSVTVADGAVLDLNGFAATANPITLNGSGLGAGALVNSGAAVTLSGAVSLATDTLVGGPGAITLNGVVSGAGELAVGDGATAFTLTLGGVNTYAGGSVVNNLATLVVTNANSLGSGAVTVNAGGTLDMSGLTTATLAGVSGSGSVLLPSSGLTFNVLSGSEDVSVLLGGSATITKLGAGTVVFQNSNTYGGGTTIGAGTLQVGDATHVGSIGSGNVVDNGVLDFVNPSSSVVSNVISGTGAVAYSGTGVFSLSGANTYSGQTRVNSGTLKLVTGGFLGSAVGETVVNAGATLDLNGQDNVAEPLRLAGGTLTNSAAGDAASTTGAVVLVGVSFIDTPNDISLSGVVSGTGGFTKTGAGVLILSGANTYTGATFLNEGTLKAGHSSAFGSSLITVNSGATLDLTGLPSGSAVTSGGIAGVGDVALGASTLIANIATGVTATYSGVLAGTGGFTKTGAGTQIFDGTNTYAGATTISAGTLQLGSGGFGGSIASTSLLNNGVLDVNIAGATTFAAAVSGSGAVRHIGAGTLTLSGNNTYTGVTTVNGGGFLKLGSASALGASGASSGTVVASGSTLDLNGFTSSETLSLSGSGSAGSGALINTAATTATLSGPVALASAVTIGGASDAGDITLSGAVTGAQSLTYAGGHTLTLSGANTFSGGLNVTSGTVLAGHANAFGSGVLDIGFGATANAAGFNQTLTGLSGFGDLNLGSASLTLNQTSNQTFYGTLSGSGSITKAGTGALSLSGSGAGFSGNVLVTAGRVVLGAAGAIGSASAVVSGSGLIDLAGQQGVANSFTLSGGTLANLASGDYILNTAATLNGNVALASTSTIRTDGDLVINGVITNGAAGTGLLVKTGAGNLVLNSANTYTGGTRIDAGTIVVGHADAQNYADVFGSGIVTLNGGLINLNGHSIRNLRGSGGILDISNTTFEVGGVTSYTLGASLVQSPGQTASLRKVLSGTTTLTGATINYSGATWVDAGSLRIGGSSVNSSGGLLGGYMANTGATLAAAPYTYTGPTGVHDGDIVLAAGAVYEHAANSFQILGNTLAPGNVLVDGVGVISGAGSLRVTAGGMHLAGANTYTGSTFVGGGAYLDLGRGVTYDTPGGGVSSVYDPANVVRNSALGLNSAVILAGGALNLNGFDAQVGSLAGTGSVWVGDRTLVVESGTDRPTSTFTGLISTAAGATLIKAGGGAWELMNTTELTDATLQVRAGELRYTGLLSRARIQTPGVSGPEYFPGLTEYGQTVSGPAVTRIIAGARLSFQNSSAATQGSLRYNAVSNLRSDPTGELQAGLDSNYRIVLHSDAAAVSNLGILSGAGRVFKTGAGTLTVQNDALLTGDVLLAQGTTVLDSAGGRALASAASVNLGHDANGRSISVVGLNPVFQVPFGTSTILVKPDFSGWGSASLSLNQNQSIRNLQRYRDPAVYASDTRADEILVTGVGSRVSENGVGHGAETLILLGDNTLTVNQSVLGWYSGQIQGGVGSRLKKTGDADLVLMSSVSSYETLEIASGRVIANIQSLGSAVSGSGELMIVQHDAGTLTSSLSVRDLVIGIGVELNNTALSNPDRIVGDDGVDTPHASDWTYFATANTGSIDLMVAQPNLRGTLTIEDGIHLLLGTGEALPNLNKLRIFNGLAAGRETLIDFKNHDQTIVNLVDDTIYSPASALAWAPSGQASFARLDMGLGSLTLDQSSSTEANALRYAGRITGSGAFILSAGANTYTVLNPVTYTGATVVRTGRLSAQTADTFANSAGLILASDSSRFSFGGSGSQKFGALFGAAGSELDMGSGSLVVGFSAPIETGADAASATVLNLLATADAGASGAFVSASAARTRTYLSDAYVRGSATVVASFGALAQAKLAALDAQTALTAAQVASAADPLNLTLANAVSAAQATLTTRQAAQVAAQAAYDAAYAAALPAADAAALGMDFAGTIRGSGGLSKIGSQTLTLSGHNVYTGDTLLNGGVLRVDGDALYFGMGVGRVFLSTGTTLQVNASAAETLPLNANLIGDVGSTVQKIGGGTVSLNAAGLYRAFTTASSGVKTPVGEFAGAFDIADGVLRLDTASGDKSLPATLTGVGVLEKIGANSLTFSLSSGAANSFAGGLAVRTPVSGVSLLSVTTGAVSLVNHITVEANTEAKLVLVGGVGHTYDAAAGLSGVGRVTFAGDTVTMTRSQAGFVGTLSPAAGATIVAGTTDVAASATLDLSGAGGSDAVFDAATYDQAFAALAGNAQGVYSLAATSLTLSGSGSSVYSGLINGSGVVSYSGSGTQEFTNLGSGSQTWSTVVSGTGTLVAHAGTGGLSLGSGPITLSSGTLRLVADGDAAVNRPLTGSGTLEVAAGTHTVVLGDTSAHSSTLGFDGSILVSSGTARVFTSGVRTTKGLFESVTLGLGATYEVDATLGPVVHDGATTNRLAELSGAHGNLRVLAGAVTLSGAQSYTGLTDVAAAGLLKVGATASVSGYAGVAVANLSGVAGAKVDISAAGGSLLLVQSVKTGTGTISGGVYDLGSSYSGDFTNAVGAVVNPDLTIVGSNVLTLSSRSVNNLTVGDFGAAGLLHVTGDLALFGALTLNGSSSHLFVDGTITDASGSASIVVNDGTLSLVAGSTALPTTVPITLNNSTLDITVNPASASLSLTGGITASGNSGLTKSGAGTLVLAPTVPVDFAGVVTINDGTLSIGNGNVTLANLTFGSAVGVSPVLDLNGRDLAIVSLSASGIAARIVDGLPSVAAAPATLTVASGNFAGTLADGSGKLGLTVSAVGVVPAGTLTLSGTNTYTGSTNVGTGATLAIASDHAFDGAGALEIFGTVQAGGRRFTTAALTGSGGLDISGGGVATVKSGSFAGTITGTGTLVKASDGTAGGGTLMLSGSTTLASAQVSGGTLALTGGTFTTTALSTTGSGLAVISGGTQQIDSGAFSAALSGSGNLTLGSLATMTVSQAGSFAGTITGTGNLVKASDGTAGGGTLSLGGHADFGSVTVTGGVLDVVGLAQVTVSGTTYVSGAGSVLHVAPTASYVTDYLVTDQGGIVSFDAAASFTVRKSGAGEIRATLVDQGTTDLDLAANAVRFVQASNTVYFGSIAAGAITLEQSAGTATTLADAVTTSGTFVKTGMGALSLSGADNFGRLEVSQGRLLVTGGVFVSSGTVVSSGAALELGAGGATGSIGDADVDLNGTLLVNRTSGFTLRNKLVGSGVFEQRGASSGVTTVYSGDASGFNGVALVSGGTLQLATTKFGASSIQVNRDSQLTLAQGGGLILSAVISGEGSVRQFGSGSTTLTGANVNTGSVLVSRGKLIVGGSAGTLGDASAAVQVSAAGEVVFSRTTNTSVGNKISGQGRVTQAGAGTVVTLTGENTYTGDTQVTAGTLRIGADSVGSIAADSVIRVSGQGLIGFGRDTATISNEILGEGGLRQMAGVTTLIGKKDYTGATLVEGGELRIGLVGVEGAVSGTSGVSVSSGAKLTLVNTEATFDRNVSLDAGATMTVARTGLMLAGSITGAGRLVSLADTSVLALNGYSGGTSVESGKLTVNYGGSLGSGSVAIAAGGTLAYVAGANVVTVSSSISGAGALDVSGSGSVALTGANSYGITTIGTGSALRIGGAFGSLGSGSVTDNGTLVFARSNDILVANVISGSGSVEQSGAGTLTLTGANVYAGATRVNSGVLRVGSASAQGALGLGGVSVASGATLDLVNVGASVGAIDSAGLVRFSQSGSLVHSGSLTGSGSVEQAGSGVTTLAGVTSYAGSTAVRSGTLKFAQNSLPTGKMGVADGATVEFAKGGTLADATLGDLKASDGKTISLVSQGRALFSSGDTVLLGTQKAGTFELSGGAKVTLGQKSDTGQVSPGKIQGSILIGSGSVLRGVGVVSGSLVNRGVVAPGYSPGVLTILGDFTSSGVLDMEVDPANKVADRIDVGGVATITGSTLHVSFLSAPEKGRIDKLLTAGGGIVGEFSSVVVDSGGAGIAVKSGSEYLLLNGVSLNEIPTAVPQDLAGFAGALSPSSTMLNPAFSPLLALAASGNGSGFATALANASPLGFAALPAMSISAAAHVGDELRREAWRMNDDSARYFGEESPYTASVGATGAEVDAEKKSRNPYFDTRSSGGYGQLARNFGPDLAVGVRASYDKGRATLHNSGGRMDSDRASATLFARTNLDDLVYASIGVFAGKVSAETRRETLTGRIMGETSGYDYGAHADVGVKIRAGDGMWVSPYVGATFAQTDFDSFTEAGSSPIAMRVKELGMTSLRGRAGATFWVVSPSRLFRRPSLSFGLDVAYEHEFMDSDATIRSSFANFAPGGSFSTMAPAAAQDVLAIGPQAVWSFGDTQSISASYRFEYGFGDTQGHRIDVGYSVRF